MIVAERNRTVFTKKKYTGMMKAGCGGMFAKLLGRAQSGRQELDLDGPYLTMIDQWIEQLRKGNCISEPDLKKLCIHVRKMSPERLLFESDDLLFTWFRLRTCSWRSQTSNLFALP
jgi:hypothetical protein